MHAALNTIDRDGIIVIGEGEKDEAPMLDIGEVVGDGTPAHVDIAVDPVDGTRLLSKGLPNAMSVVGSPSAGRCSTPARSSTWRSWRRRTASSTCWDLDRPLGKTVELVAERRGVDVRDVMVVVLDRPRHEAGIKAIREAGARVRLITDGDVAGALLGAADPLRPVDLLWGIGGTPEGVITAAALKCYGGGMIGRLWPERRRGTRQSGTGRASTSRRS